MRSEKSSRSSYYRRQKQPQRYSELFRQWLNARLTGKAEGEEGYEQLGERHTTVWLGERGLAIGRGEVVKW